MRLALHSILGLFLLPFGSIRPVVAQAFPIDDGAKAHRFMQERKNVGKVVLTM
mgnify:CR=1 FL=1